MWSYFRDCNKKNLEETKQNHYPRLVGDELTK